jgi:ABC-2 type transport system ATP-binding protein
MIEVDKVTKYYGSHPAVHDLSFNIEAGECVGFLGLNGAGKTTTLRLLSCLLLPTSGRVSIKGFDAEEQPHEIRKLIGFLPDRPPVYPEMTVSAYLSFAGKLRQMDRAAVAKRMPKVLEDAGLTHVADEPIQNLSHGYQQRVGIAQAIIHDPTLLILDEPIQGLDPVQIVEMRELIRGLRGVHTILLSTHILSEIEQTCDRIMMLHEGRITAKGTEAELAARFGADGMMTIELDVRVPEASESYRDTTRSLVRQVLDSVEGVASVESGDLDAGRVCAVTVRAAGDVRERIAKKLIDEGFGIRRLEVSSSALEDIFIQLSREDRQRDEEAAGEAAS